MVKNSGKCSTIHEGIQMTTRNSGWPGLGMYCPSVNFGDDTSSGFCVIILTHTHTPVQSRKSPYILTLATTSVRATTSKVAVVYTLTGNGNVLCCPFKAHSISPDTISDVTWPPSIIACLVVSGGVERALAFTHSSSSYWLDLVIPRLQSYCLSLPFCLEWHNRSITPRVHSGVTKRI